MLLSASRLHVNHLLLQLLSSPAIDSTTVTPPWSAWTSLSVELCTGCIERTTADVPTLVQYRQVYDSQVIGEELALIARRSEIYPSMML
jgi:hypothetical protein